MREILVIVLLLDSLAMIALILLQQGKGADAGASFGAGASGSETLFGAKGSSNFLSRTTAILATIFFVVTLALAYAPLDKQTAKSVSEVAPKEQPVPAAAPTKSDKKTKQTKKDDLPAVPQ
jgi:preprotein translocase subunit SecG